MARLAHLKLSIQVVVPHAAFQASAAHVPFFLGQEAEWHAFDVFRSVAEYFGPARRVWHLVVVHVLQLRLCWYFRRRSTQPTQVFRQKKKVFHK
jgi:hypothetical protein